MGALGLSGCISSTGPETPDEGGLGELSVVLVPIASGLDAPVYLTSPPADPRLFILEQPGRIRVVRDGDLVPEPFLDIRHKVAAGGERGLLGLAFDPDFSANGRFFVYYTRPGGDGVLEAYRDIDGSDRANPASGRVFMEVPQPFPNHNGGQIAFGPDGHLYIGLGDGGGAGDPGGRARNPRTLLGSILRISVRDGIDPPYAIPADNPFVADTTGLPEVLHYGLRNPWRFSFDSSGGRMYIADVGQSRWEEINVVSSEARGLNFGWNALEGDECFLQAGCSSEGTTLPVVVYGRNDGCSVIGGYVYAGQDLPELRGRYIYSDYCAGWLRAFVVNGNGNAAEPSQFAVDAGSRVTSMGADAQGEVYVTTEDGRALRLAPAG